MEKKTSPAPHLYVVESTQPHEQSTQGTSQSESLRGTAASRSAIAILEKEITDKLQCDLLISMDARKVKELSQKVFGKRGVFDSRIEDLINNPSSGNRILHELLTNIQSVHKLPGVSVCGLKSGARKSSIRNISPLCSAVIDLMKTAEQAQNRALFGIGMGSPKHSVKDAEQAKKLLELFNRSTLKKDFESNREAVAAVKKSPIVQKCVKNIQDCCTKVYGWPHVVDKLLDLMQRDPNMGRPFLHQIASSPQSFCKLNGVNVCGIKNKARREAEASIESLRDNLEFFSNVVRSIGSLVTIEQAEQRKQIDKEQNQEVLTQNIHHTRAEQHPTLHQGRPRKVSEHSKLSFTL